MKKSILPIPLLLFLVVSCEKEEAHFDQPKGSLVVNIGLFISINEIDKSLKSTSAVEDFKVIIFNASHQEVLSFEREADMPGEIELEPGQYYVTASSENNLPAAFDNPFYYGESNVFSITPGELTSVSVNCELANTMVSIVYTDNVRNNYTDYYTTISSSAGSLLYSGSETRAGFFQPLPLTINVVLTWQKEDGSSESKTLTGSIPSPQARKHYEIHIDAVPASGSSAIQITVDESTDPVEVVEINDGDNPLQNGVSYGDLLITEIMYDPSALLDSEGEWFEIFNNTNSPVDLYQIVIRKNDTENHIINSHITLPSHEYFVFSRSETTVSAVNRYVYGSSVTLNNTGAILSLSNYGSDGTDGSLIFSVDYGVADFPSGTGASLSLSPDHFSLAEAVLGSSWCTSSVAYNTGDFGTPGILNPNCP
ncbi:MAG: DUF4493 domain-containing protein [Bacteroidales bacterium]|nr:DUF4493 domain-containing protein [Bacteroidales bacterium]